ncbi:sulfur oxidation c-type cytochrome SoxX [Thermomonas flagellata]|uniref:sulfur oxidation c-type cytochrome SoxX n=1 Tax=Thermomonas flagellata TaxID=2888524 RepID=UPI001F035051|nr:sulfur oxidation c-type cytochrome SoxX [Thermomonas flagellata]
MKRLMIAVVPLLLAAATPMLLAAGKDTAAAKPAAKPAAPAKAGKPDRNALAYQAMLRSFKPHGQAGMDRLKQDYTQAECSLYAPDDPPPAIVRKLMERNQAAIRYPADGKYLGDWKQGEKIAQDGFGKQYSDDPNVPSGGNCYACHQLAKDEVAYGTLGPSLYNYGKLRGQSEAILKYTWGKIYDTKGMMVCSNMPRFGHMGILTEQQIRDVMALLFDPDSPVNQ